MSQTNNWDKHTRAGSSGPLSIYVCIYFMPFIYLLFIFLSRASWQVLSETIFIQKDEMGGVEGTSTSINIM